MSEAAETPSGLSLHFFSSHIDQSSGLPVAKTHCTFTTWNGRGVWNNSSRIPPLMCSSVCDTHSDRPTVGPITATCLALHWRCIVAGRLILSMTALYRELVLRTQVWQAFCSLGGKSLNKRWPAAVPRSQDHVGEPLLTVVARSLDYHNNTQRQEVGIHRLYVLPLLFQVSTH